MKSAVLGLSFRIAQEISLPIFNTEHENALGEKLKSSYFNYFVGNFVY